MNALYNEQQFDLLLAENTFIMQSREEIKQHLKLLRTCMNAINDMDAKFWMVAFAYKTPVDPFEIIYFFNHFAITKRKSSHSESQF